MHRPAILGALILGVFSGLALAQRAPDTLTRQNATAAVMRLDAAVRQAREQRSQSSTKETLELEQQLADSIHADPGQLFVSFTKFGTVHHVWSPFVDVPMTPREFLDGYADLFGVSAKSLVSGQGPTSLIRLRDGETTARFLQRADDGLPVFAADVQIHMSASGGIQEVTANVLPRSALTLTKPRLSSRTAISRAGRRAASAVAGYYNPALFGKLTRSATRLAWRVHVLEPSERFVFIDDRTGKTLLESSLSVGDVDRQIFQCDRCEEGRLPGVLQYADVCIPPFPPDPASCISPAMRCTDLDRRRFCIKADEVPMSGTSKELKDALIQIERFFSERLGRDGWDNGLRPPLHRTRASSDVDGARGRDDCQAAWRSLSAGVAPAQIIVGSRRACRDVVAHEYVHAVFDVRDGLAPSCSEAGAIQQGFSDVFGELIEKYIEGRTDWRHAATCPLDCRFRGIDPRTLVTPGSTLRLCGSCGSVATIGRAFHPPESWSFYRPECNGDFNSSLVGKLGNLMGRDPSEGAETHGGLAVTGIGGDAANVWYDVEEHSLSSSSTIADLRVAFLGACTRRGAAISRPCATAIESMGIWSPDVVEPFIIDPRGDPRRNAAIGDRSTEALAFFYRPPAAGAIAGELMFQRRSCNLLKSCGAWSAPAIWRHAAVGPDRIVPHTPVVARRLSADELWVCYRDSGISCDYVDAGGIHRGPISGPIDIVGDISAAFVGDTLFVAYLNARSELILFSHHVGDRGFSRPTALRGSGGVMHSSVAPVLASGVVGLTQPLFIAFVAPDGDGLPHATVERVNTATHMLDAGWTPTSDGVTFFTGERPALAIFQGRLHLAITAVRDDPDSRDVRAPNSVWITTVNPPPARSDAQSPLVPQHGFFFTRGFTFYEGVGGALHFVHIAPDDMRLARRFKMSN